MKIERILVTAVALALSGTPMAHAGTKIMASGPAARGWPTTQSMQCNILNGNPAPKTVTIDVMDYSGTVLSSSGPVLLAAETAASVTDSSLGGSWCRFTVDGNPKKYRALAIYGDGTKYTTVNVAQ